MFTVVGIAETPLGGQSSDVYVKLSQLQAVADRTGRVNTVYVRAESSDDVAAVADRIEQTLDGASVTTAGDLADRVSGTLVDAKNLAGSLGTALMIVGLLSAFLIASLLTLSSVTKRVRELGTLKALGWSQGLVVRQVTGESLIQGLLGGAVGVLLGVAGALAISAFGPTLEATVSAVAEQGPRFGPFGQGAVEATATEVALDAPVSATMVLWAVGLALLGGLVAGAVGKPACFTTPPRRRSPTHRLTQGAMNMTSIETSAVYELRNVSRTYTLGGVDVRAVREIDLTLTAGESVAIVGPSGSGQDDAPAAPRRARSSVSEGELLFEGRDVAQPRRSRALRAPARRARLRLPAVQPHPDAHGRAERRDRARSDVDSRERRGGSACSGSSLRSVSPSGPITCRASCPVASSSASRSRVPWRTTRTCCSPTSRPGISTRRRAPRSWICSSRSRATSSAER